MKHLYTTALAAAVALSASALTPAKTTAVVKCQTLTAEATTVLPTMQRAKAEAPGFSSINEVAGEYVWSYYGLLSNNSGQREGVVTITVTDAAAGTVTIDGIYSSGTGIQGKITGTVDLTAGTLTVANKQNLGADSYGDTNYFYFKAVDDEGNILDGAADVESVAATIKDKKFTFPEDYCFAVGDFNDENLGWWTLTAFNEFYEYTEPDDNLDTTEWTKFCTATMLDGWVIPGLKYNDGTYAEPADFPLTVNILQNNEDENLYAVENPYLESSGFPLSGGANGYIVLDLSDPEFVLVMPGVFCGYTNGTNRLHNFNLEGFYTEAGYTKDEIIAGLDVAEFSSYKVENGKTVVSIPTCRFNYPAAADKAYSWTGRADAMKATITFDKATTGINDAIVDADANAPATFYNLQGQRVANPTTGIYVKVQGGKATKVAL